jgi:hypothetical protein
MCSSVSLICVSLIVNANGGCEKTTQTDNYLCCLVDLLPGKVRDIFCLLQCGKLPRLLSVTRCVAIVLSLVFVCSPDNKNNTCAACVISHDYCHATDLNW